MTLVVHTFGRDSADPDHVPDEVEDAALIVADAYNQSPILTSMNARQRNGAFSVDQPGEVGGGDGVETVGLAAGCNTGKIYSIARRPSISTR